MAHIAVGGGILKTDGIVLYVRIEQTETKTGNAKDPDTTLADYKIYCFDGKAKLLLKVGDRYTDKTTTYDYFDEQGNWLALTWGGPRSKKEPDLPARFEDLKKTAEKLSKGLPQVRVDLYIVQDHIYFGEMTFYDGSGFESITPPIWDTILGNWLKLPER